MTRKVKLKVAIVDSEIGEFARDYEIYSEELVPEGTSIHNALTEIIVVQSIRALGTVVYEEWRDKTKV